LVGQGPFAGQEPFAGQGPFDGKRPSVGPALEQLEVQTAAPCFAENYIKLENVLLSWFIKKYLSPLSKLLFF